MEFIHIGPKFSNHILQTLIVLIKKRPPNPDRKLLIIGTTSLLTILEELSVLDCFNVSLDVPSIKTGKEMSKILDQFNCQASENTKISEEIDKQQKINEGIPIKTLMLAIDIAIQESESGKIEFHHFK